MARNGPRSLTDLRRFELFGELEDDELQAIRAELETLSAQQAHALNLEDLLLIWEGEFHLIFYAADGDRVHLRTLLAGDHLGAANALLGKRAPPAYALEAEHPGALLRLAGAKFRAFVDAMPALQHAALELLAHHAFENANRIFELTALSERQRLYAQLLQLAQQAQGASALIAPKPRLKSLAALIGSRQEAVESLLNQMAVEGLIALCDTHIRIADAPLLQDEVETALERLSERWRH